MDSRGSYNPRSPSVNTAENIRNLSTTMPSIVATTALALFASIRTLAMAHPHSRGEHQKYRHGHHANHRSLFAEKRQDTTIPTINQPMVGSRVVHPCRQTNTPQSFKEKRQDSTIPAVDQPMVGPPNVHPYQQSYTPPPFLGRAAHPTLTTSTSVPSAWATASETTTLILQPTTFTSAVYDGTLVPVASFTDVPTATMADALPGCTPMCKQVDGQGQCVAVAGCVGSQCEDSKAKSEGVIVGNSVDFRMASALAGMIAVGMVMWML